MTQKRKEYRVIDSFLDSSIGKEVIKSLPLENVYVSLKDDIKEDDFEESAIVFGFGWPRDLYRFMSDVSHDLYRFMDGVWMKSHIPIPKHGTTIFHINLKEYLTPRTKVTISDITPIKAERPRFKPLEKIGLKYLVDENGDRIESFKTGDILFKEENKEMGNNLKFKVLKDGPRIEYISGIEVRNVLPLIQKVSHEFGILVYDNKQFGNIEDWIFELSTDLQTIFIHGTISNDKVVKYTYDIPTCHWSSPVFSFNSFNFVGEHNPIDDLLSTYPELSRRNIEEANVIDITHLTRKLSGNMYITANLLIINRYGLYFSYKRVNSEKTTWVKDMQGINDSMDIGIIDMDTEDILSLTYMSSMTAPLDPYIVSSPHFGYRTKVHTVMVYLSDIISNHIMTEDTLKMTISWKLEDRNDHLNLGWRYNDSGEETSDLIILMKDGRIVFEKDLINSTIDEVYPFSLDGIYTKSVEMDLYKIMGLRVMQQRSDADYSIEYILSSIFDLIIRQLMGPAQDGYRPYKLTVEQKNTLQKFIYRLPLSEILPITEKKFAKRIRKYLRTIESLFDKMD